MSPHSRTDANRGGTTIPPETKPIVEMADVYSGYAPRSHERLVKGKYLLLGGRNINDGRFRSTEKDRYIGDVPSAGFQRAIARPGDIIVSLLFDRRKLHVYQESDPRAVVNSSCAIIRAPKANDYIASYLRTIEGREQFIGDASAATSSTYIPHLTVRDLRKIRVPLLAASDLQRFGDEHIESAASRDLIRLRSQLRAKVTRTPVTLHRNPLPEGQEFARVPGTVVNDTLVIPIPDFYSEPLPEGIDVLFADHPELAQFIENRFKKVQAQIERNDLLTRIKHGETEKLEFKASLRGSVRDKHIELKLESSVLKEVVAFCNTEGGEVLIGVGDDGSILGIEHEGFPNPDKFLLHLGDIIKARITPNVMDLVDTETTACGGKTICQVTCRKSRDDDVWLKDRGSEAFYVRFGPSARPLEPREAAAYIRKHFRTSAVT